MSGAAGDSTAFLFLGILGYIHIAMSSIEDAAILLYLSLVFSLTRHLSGSKTAQFENANVPVLF